MQVISFKVDDDVYLRLKARKQSFRVLFEPYAIELSQNNSRGMKYTGGIPNISPEVIVDLVSIQKTVEKILSRTDGIFTKKQKIVSE